MRADMIRIHPHEHYAELQRRITADFAGFGRGEIDAAALNARMAELLAADPFSVLLVLRYGPRDVARGAFLHQLAQAMGADQQQRQALDRAIADAPVLDLPSDSLLHSYATALPNVLSADGWLEQVVAIMAALDPDTGAPYGDFWMASDIARQLSPLLGYPDQTRRTAKGYVPPGGDDIEWGAGYTGSQVLFIDLFGQTRARAEQARQVAAGAEALPPHLQAQVYGWLLDPNIEYHMGVGRIPSELPPEIARIAPTLGALHSSLTARLMHDFDMSEREMTEA